MKGIPKLPPDSEPRIEVRGPMGNMSKKQLILFAVVLILVSLGVLKLISVLGIGG